MMKNNDSIRLFKKNRVKDDTILELLTKEDSSNTEPQFSDIIIRPLEPKNKDLSSNSNQSPLSPAITEIIQKALTMLNTDRKDNFSLNSLMNSNLIRNLPIWSIFRKPK